LGTFHGLSH